MSVSHHAKTPKAMSKASGAPAPQPVNAASYAAPDDRGRFGAYGGAFVPEVLIPELDALTRAFRAAWDSESFQRDYRQILCDYVGRPTPLTFADRLSRALGGPRIYLKREDLCHTGAHKINNTVGQILLARRMGKTRIIAETGAGQHGVATATVAAKFALECIVYMGAEDMQRQRLNVERMRMLGAEVRPAISGSQTLKDATNEAIRDWVSHPHNTFYIIGSVVGPHPYPMMVRTFQEVIGKEARAQLLQYEGRACPDVAIACVGGGSNAMGLFYSFLGDARVRLIGVEAAGEGLDSRHAATLSCGTPGVLHGALSYLLQDGQGQVMSAHSISAGLDYPGVGPEHAYLKDLHRITYEVASDEEALHAVRLLSQTEGIIPALETAHAVAALARMAPKMTASDVVVLCCSGRGDKDMTTIMGADVAA